MVIEITGIAVVMQPSLWPWFLKLKLSAQNFLEGSPTHLTLLNPPWGLWVIDPHEGLWDRVSKYGSYQYLAPSCVNGKLTVSG